MNVRKLVWKYGTSSGSTAPIFWHVLGLLLHEDVDDVVDRDDAEQLAVVGHDGHDVEVVLRHAARDVLLVHRRRHAR